jgi:hypothetical protein
MIADKWQLSREAMEVFSLESHHRAQAATDAGYFDREILPYQGLTADETIRDTSLEAMSQLQPLQEGGTITAAVSSQTCDGASAVLIVSEAALKRYNLVPRARIAHMTVRADDPIWMLTAPIPATARTIGNCAAGYRSRRDQRGVCAGAHGLAGGDRLSPYANERQWWSHCTGASFRGYGNKINDNLASRDGASTSSIRVANHV